MVYWFIEDLRAFCKKYDLDIPTFEFTSEEDTRFCKVIWYDKEIVSTSEVGPDRKDNLRNKVLDFLAEWVGIDENYIQLITDDLRKYRQCDCCNKKVEMK